MRTNIAVAPHGHGLANRQPRMLSTAIAVEQCVATGKGGVCRPQPVENGNKFTSLLSLPQIIIVPILQYNPGRRIVTLHCRDKDKINY